METINLCCCGTYEHRHGCFLNQTINTIDNMNVIPANLLSIQGCGTINNAIYVTNKITACSSIVSENLGLGGTGIQTRNFLDKYAIFKDIILYVENSNAIALTLSLSIDSYPGRTLFPLPEYGNIVIPALSKKLIEINKSLHSLYVTCDFGDSSKYLSIDITAVEA